MAAKGANLDTEGLYLPGAPTPGSLGSTIPLLLAMPGC